MAPLAPRHHIGTDYGADLVVLATGSSWRGDGGQPGYPDPMPGADAALPHVLTPEQVCAGKRPPGPPALAATGISRLYRIGDAVAPRMISEAIFDGHRLAREIDQDGPAQPAPYRRERPDLR